MFSTKESSLIDTPGCSYWKW